MPSTSSGHYLQILCCWLVIATGEVCGALGSTPGPAPAPLGQATLRGRVTSAQEGCSNSEGSAPVRATAVDLDPSFAGSVVTCHFVAWSTLQQLLEEDTLAEGSTNNSSTILAALEREVFSIPGSNSTILPLTSLDEGVAEGSQYSVACNVDADLAEVGVVLLAQDSLGGTGGGVTLVLPDGELQRGPQVTSVQPALGPLSGGTDVYIQGQGLRSPVTCTFMGVGASLNVTASTYNSTTAMCTAPSWPPGNLSAGLGVSGEGVTLVVTSGGCATLQPFEYYSEPLITGVYPLSGPRYGSFQLTVNLGAMLDLSIADQVDLWPMVRISGADLNGSDLLLPANLTSDRQGLMAETPVERSPLSPGDHRVHISLNGQQFTDAVLLDATTLTVEGPALFMSQPYYSLSGDEAEVELGVSLQGVNALPVVANLSVSHRSLKGNTTLEVAGSSQLGLSYALSTEELTWAAGQTGTQTVKLTLSGNASAILSGGGLLVSIDGAENADVVPENSTSIVSALAAEQLTVGFALVPNQVVYRGENASIPVDITNAAMRLPASARYDILTQAGEVPPYLEGNDSSGFLQWDLQSGDRMWLEVPINWSLVEPQTEDHLSIVLTDVWNAQVPEEQNAVALHVFGVEEGQCPPGTFRWDGSPTPPPTSAPAKPGPASAPHSSIGWLRSLVVWGGDDWSFDLSSQFQSNVSEYGVIVPSNFDNATLCAVPFQEYAVVMVEDSLGNTLPSDHVSVASVSSFSASPVATGGRRLQTAKSVAVPLAGPAVHASNASTVLALGKKGLDRSLECRGDSWSLPLEAGQNDFSITAGTPAKMAKPPPPTAQLKANGTTASHISSLPDLNPLTPQVDGRYVLSVVRLARPSHADMVELNVTENNVTFSVCRSEPGLTSNRTQGATANLTACLPNQQMQVNVSYETSYVRLHPALRFPSLQNLRVEVAGQVLSQGGNVGADQLADTTATTTQRENSDFLPVAYIVGLQPGIPVLVPIVVVAEDGVTSNRYYLTLTRGRPPKGTNSSSDLLADFLAASPGPGERGVDIEQGGPSAAPVAELEDATLLLAATSGGSLPPPATQPGEMQEGWPVPPSREDWCHACPAGWATSRTDQDHCTMCTPGSYAQTAQSPACLQCPNGTYTDSWGSSNCNHCIIGTFAPYQGSRLCFMCPENMTNLEDGSTACSVPVQPGTNLTMRYAVIVSFGVYLNGTTLEEIASKVGVNASSTVILERLIRSDTATAFNITSRDVNVTGISQIARRVLLVNITATLGVDLPVNSSQDAIQAELAVKNLSADDAIDMLSSQPDRFLGRTTKALDVTAEAGNTPPTRVESRPKGVGPHDHLPWYGVMLLVLGIAALLGIAGRIWRKRLRKMYNSLHARWWSSRSHRLGEAGEKEGLGEGAEAEGTLGGRGGSKLTSRGKAGSSAKAPDKEPIYSSTEYSDSPAVQ